MKSFLWKLLLLIGGLLSAAITGAIFFLSAGRWDLPTGWAVVAVVAVLSSTGMLAVDPGLMRERMKPGPGARDQLLVYWGRLLAIATLVIAGLDVGRYGWSDSVPLALQVLALIGFALGLGLAIWSMHVNRFFSAVVRLQEERGHHLITDGPYQWVRHPGYAGILVGTPCIGLALGSWLSVLPMLVFGALILRRLLIEDGFLLASLEGYTGYAEKVRYRLLPGVW